MVAKEASASRKPKGEGTTISIDFKDYPEVLEHIRSSAKADDREPSKWLRRHIVQQFQKKERA
jgi:hypothetical protein